MPLSPYRLLPVAHDDENASLESSAIALLFNLILSANTFDFYTSFAIEVVFHQRFRAILVMEIIPHFMDVQRLYLVLKNSIEFTAIIT